MSRKFFIVLIKYDCRYGKMNKYEAVKNMQIYIENNLDKKITLADLAKVCYYSPWYSYRLFQEILNMSPAEYIRKLRLSKSALELRDKKRKIIDVAYKYGYDSVDGYQRAFFREFKVNPYEYSIAPKPLCLFTPYKKYDDKEKKTMSEVSNVFVSIVEKPQRKVIIKRGIKADNYIDYCMEVGCDVWGILSSIKSLDNEPVCLWLPKKYVKENTSVYVQGAEVSLDYTDIPEGFDTIILPKATYLKFNGEPFEEENYGQAIENLWKAIEKFKPENMGYQWDDQNPRIQLEPIGSRGYIELLSVKKI